MHLVFLYKKSLIILKRDIIGFSFTFHFVTYLFANDFILNLFMIFQIIASNELQEHIACKLHLDGSQSLRRSLLSEVGMSIMRQTH